MEYKIKMTSYLISDTHFGHANIIKFTDNDGKKTRPFHSVEEIFGK